VIGKDEGEIHGVKETEKSLRIVMRKTALLFAQEESCSHPQSDSFAVVDLTVGDRGFNAVTNCVAKVEKSSEIESFFFIGFDNASLDGKVTGKEIGKTSDGREREPDADFIAKRTELLDHFSLPNSCMLDDFGHPFSQGSGVKGDEGCGVNDDNLGLVEGSHEVLPFRDVDGRFATDGTVGLSDDCGWNLDVRDSTVVDRGHKARKVTHDTATESSYCATAIKTCLNKGRA
jgi:hypothetical protein